MRIIDWSSDVCSSDLQVEPAQSKALAPRTGRGAIARPEQPAARARSTGAARLALGGHREISDDAGAAVPARTHRAPVGAADQPGLRRADRKSTRLNSSH